MPAFLSRRFGAALAIVTAAAVVTAGSVGAAADPSGPSARALADVPAAPALGMMGPYDESRLGELRAAGVRETLVEMAWESAEPSEGVLDTRYLDGIAHQVRVLRDAGFAVALNTGLDRAPQWLLAKPGARFVDQTGRVFTEHPNANLVFGAALRPHAERYLAAVFDRLGTDFSVVRAGGGFWGELTYPKVVGADGRVENRYWAFDENAARSNPVPGWRPGDPSPRGEAARFLDWYLDALAGFQNWQVDALRRAGFAGTVAMLYPSYGMRPGDFDAAVATNLSGTSSAEVNGEVQRGYDVARHIAALRDPRVAVYGTWGEQPEIVRYLASLARARGLAVMAENSGGNTATQLDVALRTAAEEQLAAFYVVRAPQLLCHCNGYATLDEVAASYRAIGPTTPTSSASPTEQTPTDAAPTEATPTEAARTEATPTEAAPTEAAPTEAAPTTTPTQRPPKPKKKRATMQLRASDPSVGNPATRVTVRLRPPAGAVAPKGRIVITVTGAGVRKATSVAAGARPSTVRITLPRRGVYRVVVRYPGNRQWATLVAGRTVRY